eukprot:5769401-Prymnesium_polylepis.1
MGVRRRTPKAPSSSPATAVAVFVGAVECSMIACVAAGWGRTAGALRGVACGGPQQDYPRRIDEDSARQQRWHERRLRWRRGGTCTDAHRSGPDPAAPHSKAKPYLL